MDNQLTVIPDNVEIYLDKDGQMHLLEKTYEIVIRAIDTANIHGNEPLNGYFSGTL